MEASSFLSDKASPMYSASDWAPLAESGPFIFLAVTLKLLWRKPLQVLKLLLRRMRVTATYPFQPLFPIQVTKNAVVSWVVAVRIP
jgi:hypothetical protein